MKKTSSVGIGGTPPPSPFPASEEGGPTAKDRLYLPWPYPHVLLEGNGVLSTEKGDPVSLLRLHSAQV